MEKDSSDDRFSESNYKTEIASILQNPNERYTNYSILSEKVIDNSTELLVARVTNLNTSVYEIPFKLIEKNGTWIVSISESLPAKNEFKQIYKGKEISENLSTNSNSSTSNTSNIIITPKVQVATWSLDCYRLAQSTCSMPHFNMSSNHVNLNLRQWGVSTNATFEYDLVHLGLFYNTQYGSTTISGNNQNSGRSATIYSSTAQSDVVVKVVRVGISSGTITEAYSYGEVYQ